MAWTRGGNLFLVLIFSSLILAYAEDAMVIVRGAMTIANTDKNFICATLDWWPPEKCNYDQCPWGRASILNLRLKNPILNKAVKAFGSLRVRLGGSLQDQVIYKVGKHGGDCTGFRTDENGLFGFTKGCLRMHRWDKVNAFLKKNGAIVTFGLNALIGREKLTEDGLYGGNWDPTNARDLIDYSVKKGHDIESWELGNELCSGGVEARVEPEQYAQDMLALRRVVDDIYKDSIKKPKLLAPGGFFDRQWFARFLQASGPNMVDAITHHIYNLGPGDDANLIHKVQDTFYLSQAAQTYKDAEATIKNFGPWSSAWVGESGGAYNSGGRTVSHTFANSFWYLDQLGMTSTFDHKVFCRQALIGGNYALLNTTSFIPNPDYYGALLWHRLMGQGVLSTKQEGSPDLRAYTHCTKRKPGVTVMLINLSNSTSFDVSVVNDESRYSRGHARASTSEREEYHLTPRDGNIQSDVLLLNGAPLRLTSNNGIPKMKPITADGSSPIYVAAQSIVFAHLKDFVAPACNN